MNLQELQKNWNQFGEIDPLFAILTDPTKKENRWEEDLFFNTGINDVDLSMDYLKSLNIQVRPGRALDFGCGVGRLTQALCRYFDRCDGVDIAASMVELARKYNKFGNCCQYHVNTRDDLLLFEKDRFDFIYSMIVLQHIEPQYCFKYLQEFIRVLKPGGIALFQIPDGMIIKENDPLPETSFKAEISATDPPAQLEADVRSQIKVTLLNKSATTWPGANGGFLKHPIRVGNHWLSSDGSVVKHDDGRVGLTGDLGPQETTELNLTITAPRDPGDYILELDAVQEGIGWFQRKGSQTERLPVRIIAGKKYPSPHGNSQSSHSYPLAEMHCIAKDDIVALLESEGASIIDICEDIMARPAYGSYRYCITK